MFCSHSNPISGRALQSLSLIKSIWKSAIILVFSFVAVQSIAAQEISLFNPANWPAYHNLGQSPSDAAVLNYDLANTGIGCSQILEVSGWHPTSYLCHPYEGFAISSEAAQWSGGQRR